MNIGPYHLSRQPSGPWVIQWFDHASSTHQRVIIDDLVPVIDDLVREHQAPLDDCIATLTALVCEEAEFMKSPDAALLSFITDDRLVRPADYATWTLDQKFRRFVENFVHGFNGLTGDNVQAPMVEAHVRYLDMLAEQNGLL